MKFGHNQASKPNSDNFALLRALCAFAVNSSPATIPRISAPLSRKNLPENPSPDDILNAFLDYLSATEVEPYDHQEEAILELFAGNNVILNTPTGSGKSLVALALQFKSLCQRRRSSSLITAN